MEQIIRESRRVLVGRHLFDELLEEGRDGGGAVVEAEVRDKDDDADEGGPHFTRGGLEEVLAEARGVRKENLLTKPQAHLPGIPGGRVKWTVRSIED